MGQDTASGIEPTAVAEPAPRDPLVRAVWALGITELIAWGSTFYALGVLGRPISADTGWSQSLVFGGMSAGLAASALLSAWIGRLVDRHGGRPVMTIGLALAALGLASLAVARSETAYVAGWLLLGPAMRMTLYDAAFAAIVQVLPSRGRRAVSYLTLFGGLASTVFWPLGHWLDAVVGWRGALLTFAALNLLVALPLAWWGLAARETSDLPHPPAGPPSGAQHSDHGHSDHVHPPLDAGERLAALLLFGLVLAGNALVFGALSVHLVTILQSAGLAIAAAVSLASLKGGAQVAGRLWELLIGYRLSALTVGRIAMGLLPVALAVLMAGGDSVAAALVFTLLLGVSNGLVTIVRGAVPLALFGSDGYGAMLGRLAAPQLLMHALAPFAFAAVVEAWGMRAGLGALLVVAMLSMVAMEATALWVRRLRGRAAPAR
jgi:MFS family permease